MKNFLFEWKLKVQALSCVRNLDTIQFVSSVVINSEFMKDNLDFREYIVNPEVTMFLLFHYKNI